MRYLNSKADMAFYRVFGEQPDLAMSLLNALLPLAPGEDITKELLSPKSQVPD